MHLLMEIGDRIRKARTDAGLSQRQLAAKVGVSDGLVGQWETHRKDPGRDNLFKIAEATLVDPTSLIRDLPKEEGGVRITDPRDLRFLRRFKTMPRKAQDNLFELMNMTANVPRKVKHKSQPAEAQ